MRQSWVWTEGQARRASESGAVEAVEEAVLAGRGGSRRRREGGSCRRRGEGGSGSRADGPLPNLGSCQPCDSRGYGRRARRGVPPKAAPSRPWRGPSRPAVAAPAGGRRAAPAAGGGERGDSPSHGIAVSQYVSRVTEGFALGPRRDRPRGPRPPPGRWASAGRGGMGAAWRGRGFALGPRDRPQYSPDRRVIVSCRGARASVVSGAAGAGSRATFAARPVGFRRTRGHGCRLAERGGVDGHLDR